VSNLRGSLHMHQSPVRLVIIIALSVFVSEAFVMIIISFLQPSSTLFEVLFDSTFLVVLLSPMFYFSIFRPLVLHTTERKRAERELQRNCDAQTVINSLLRLSLEDIPLEELLRRALDLLLSVPWLAIESRGSIFLVEDEPEVLVMKVQKELEEVLQKLVSVHTHRQPNLQGMV